MWSLATREVPKSINFYYTVRHFVGGIYSFDDSHTERLSLIERWEGAQWNKKLSVGCHHPAWRGTSMRDNAAALPASLWGVW